MAKAIISSMKLFPAEDINNRFIFLRKAQEIISFKNYAREYKGVNRNGLFFTVPIV